ncbi:6-phospho-beta-glucosidase [Oceanobacillus oncorhynchi subsp. incaldanensis]|uniref:Putative 6-phospho-beta-glucosidase n=1 Tax=Oceanobacillus oncorhynchi TaxID=545501 RepID=A0A0A1MQC8_9BACI|nr:6-phospho-beta-glucosidase [Oceanobacillus oncorhynchi]GIO18554.1 6-phospho-beta-glucosidase [Oceanobacillus oncorhynchi subsp. incaldanensis]CEI81934.1 putative 6-phospho-beta-glucosidase [Oceanobacillus oncorhynchi]
MKSIKLAIIGGGSSYTPELLEGVIAEAEHLPIKEVWLVDIPAGERKLHIIEALAKRMIKKSGLLIHIFATMDREKAIEGADYVITQFRVGQLEMRRNDEYISMKHGVIGQETTGAGGFMKALRTIPVILEICKEMERLAPDAWLLNFTNPAGVVTEAVLKHSKIKVVGLCNNPINFYKKFAAVYDVPVEAVRIHFTGVNHLIWITELYIHGQSHIQDVLTGQSESYEAANIPNFDWDMDFLQSLGAIPCGYHRYYYQTDTILKKQRAGYKNKKTRADQVQKVEKELFELYQNPELDRKPEALEQRGGAYYSEAAIQLMKSIHLDTQHIHTLNVRNNGAISCLPESACVEVNCIVEKHKITPLQTSEPSPQIRGLLQIVKAYEELTVEAATTGNKGIAIQALTLHPLIPSADKAKEILDDMLAVNKPYLNWN